MVQRLQGNNKQTQFKGVIIAVDAADRATYVPVTVDVGAVLIQLDTLQTYTVIPGPALQQDAPVGANYSNVFGASPGPTAAGAAIAMVGLPPASPESGSLAFTPVGAFWTVSKAGVYEFDVIAFLTGTGAAEALDLQLFHAAGAGIIARSLFTYPTASSEGFFGVSTQLVMAAGETVGIRVGNAPGAAVTPSSVMARAKQIA